jgi:hypothetical protein
MGVAADGGSGAGLGWAPIMLVMRMERRRRVEGKRGGERKLKLKVLNRKKTSCSPRGVGRHIA